MRERHRQGDRADGAAVVGPAAEADVLESSAEGAVGWGPLARRQEAVGVDRDGLGPRGGSGLPALDGWASALASAAKDARRTHIVRLSPIRLSPRSGPGTDDEKADRDLGRSIRKAIGHIRRRDLTDVDRANNRLQEIAGALECRDCGLFKTDVRRRPDPYDLEVHGSQAPVVPVLLCDACYKRSQQEI